MCHKFALRYLSALICRQNTAIKPRVESNLFELYRGGAVKSHQRWVNGVTLGTKLLREIKVSS